VAGIDTPGITGGTVPGTVPGVVRKVVCDVVWIAVCCVIPTGTCRTRRKGIRSPVRTAIVTVTSMTTGKVTGSVTGEASQSTIREGTCGKVLGATCTAIPLVFLRAPVRAQRQYQQQRAAVVRRLVSFC
jgi:hypothetical protein